MSEDQRDTQETLVQKDQPNSTFQQLRAMPVDDLVFWINVIAS